jgi:cytidine deaminase
MDNLPNELSEEKAEELIERADKVRKNTFSTYHSGSIGAALLTDSGKIYCAPYFESKIQGLGTCAERNAVGSAVADGEYKFKAIAIISDKEKPPSPCGACRQILSEFTQVSQHDIRIIMAGQDGSKKEKSLTEMLPDSLDMNSVDSKLEEYR